MAACSTTFSAGALREAYAEIAKAEPQRCVVIDANADVDTVAARVWSALRDRFPVNAASNVPSPA